MTAARYVTIWCDGKTADGHDCPEYVEGEDAADGRRNATGWLVGLPSGRDLCPAHHDQRRAETRWGQPAEVSS